MFGDVANLKYDEHTTIIASSGRLDLREVFKSYGRMEWEGQSTASNPSAMLVALISKRDKLQHELQFVERQVYDLETSYLQDSNQRGSVLKGFSNFLSSSKSTSNLKRCRKFQPEDRLFSLSSITSPAVEELVAARDGGRSEHGPGRSKGGRPPASGQGKPKKGGRIASRESKWLRPSSAHEFDDDDYVDMNFK